MDSFYKYHFVNGRTRAAARSGVCFYSITVNFSVIKVFKKISNNGADQESAEL